MTHLTDMELRAWREGRLEGRDRVIAHLAECDRCGGLLAEMLRTAPPAAGAAPQTLDVETFREAGRNAGVWQAGPRRSWWRHAPALAAAAAIVLAVVYFVPFDRSPSVTRGGESAVRLLRPSDTVTRAGLKFVWEGPDGVYRLRVFDLDSPDTPVIARDDAKSGYEPADDERAKLRTGVTYRWFVERPEAGASSPAGRFTIR